MQALVGDLITIKSQEYHLMLFKPQSNLSLQPNLNTYRGHLDWMEVAWSKHRLGMPAAMLVCKTMHWRNSSKWQGCTESTSITCVHNAVARNSLTYLTALDTPDRSEMDKRIKEEVKTHSQNQSQSCKKEKRTQIGKQTYKSASVWYWAADWKQKGSKGRGNCASASKAVFGLSTKVSVLLQTLLWTQAPSGWITAFRRGFRLGYSYLLRMDE